MADGVDPLPALSKGAGAFADDGFLQPVLAEDGLLAYDYDEEEEHEECASWALSVHRASCASFLMLWPSSLCRDMA